MFLFPLNRIFLVVCKMPSIFFPYSSFAFNFAGMTINCVHECVQYGTKQQLLLDGKLSMSFSLPLLSCSSLVLYCTAFHRVWLLLFFVIYSFFQCCWHGHASLCFTECSGVEYIRYSVFASIVMCMHVCQCMSALMLPMDFSTLFVQRALAP